MTESRQVRRAAERKDAKWNAKIDRRENHRLALRLMRERRVGVGSKPKRPARAKPVVETMAGNKGRGLNRVGNLQARLERKREAEG